MDRHAAPLQPRKVFVNGSQVRWKVRIPQELCQQEGGMRRFFAKEGEAKGFCIRLASDLRNYSDKARGLTDAQKIEAQAAFEQLRQYQTASLTVAVAHLHRADGERVSVVEVSLERVGTFPAME